VKSWASEGFFQRGPLGVLPEGVKSGEICLLHAKLRKPFFAKNFKIQGGLAPSYYAHG